MVLLRTGLFAVPLAIALLAQTPFATIADPGARADAIRDARRQLIVVVM